jgi:hypothetical protein
VQITSKNVLYAMATCDYLQYKNTPQELLKVVKIEHIMDIILTAHETTTKYNIYKHIISNVFVFTLGPKFIQNSKKDMGNNDERMY